MIHYAHQSSQTKYHGSNTATPDLRASLPAADLKASTVLPPVAVANVSAASSAPVVAPVAVHANDAAPTSPRLRRAGSDVKVAAEVDFSAAFQQSCAKVDTAIAAADKITQQKEVTEQELNKAIAHLEQLREEVCSYPTENEDLKAKYELNFRSTPVIQPHEAYAALVRLKVIDERERNASAAVIYERLNRTENVLKALPANKEALKEIRQLGYIFRNGVTKATYDAFIAGRQVKGIDSKRIAEISATVLAKKSELDTMKQRLARKQEDQGDEWEEIERVGRPSRPDFVTRTVRIPHAQIAAHAPLAVAPAPYFVEAPNGRPAPAVQQQSYWGMLYDAAKYLFKH